MDIRRRSAASHEHLLLDVARSLGFRSVEHVSVQTGGGRTTAEVAGVLHRYPLRVPVSLAVAARLARAGAPLHIDLGPPRTVSA